MLDLQTRVEILQTEQKAWDSEREQMQFDIVELEGQLAKLAVDMKDQDCDYLGIADENEDFENQFDELMSICKKDQLVINQQREILEQLENDKNELLEHIEERDQIINDRDFQIAELVSMTKKRSRGEFE